jgi:hypothetical protein
MEGAVIFLITRNSLLKIPAFAGMIVVGCVANIVRWLLLRIICFEGFRSKN